MNKRYVGLDSLVTFLNQCKNLFANINHNHTISNVENLQTVLDTMQESIDGQDDRLPIVTNDDNGAFLRVQNGVWQTNMISNAEDGEF